jgi:Na+/proline symporter
MNSTLAAADWAIIGAFLVLTMGLGLYFSCRAGASVQSFFVSNRELPWLLSGVSLLATSFASDTPLWISSLVRQYGVHYVWQYWAPCIGGTLALVLFARLWRRTGVLTDIELIELRYSGRPAAFLRGWTALATALLFCPVIIGWVTKAMETITREAFQLPEEYRIWTTVCVVVVALISCTLSGLWGVVYTDFVQFAVATVGTIALAVISVNQVGGLDAMVTQLQNQGAWSAHGLDLMPQVGNAAHQMSPWNFIGFFGIIWMHVAYSGGFAAQRLLACKSERDASFAMLTLSVLYYGIICWPWILVALCSIILLPNLGAGVVDDAAYPRMVVQLLPAGLRGLLLASLLAAFMSTISTMFNWGSSYLVNDVYKRFLVRDAKPHHYVTIGRICTVVMAIIGGVVSFAGDNILQLVYIAFLLWGPFAIIGFMRWFWWRMNALGELAASLTGYALALTMVFFPALLDAPIGRLLGTELSFCQDPNLVGARMAFVTLIIGTLNIAVSLLTRPTSPEALRAFLISARPFQWFWRKPIEAFDIRYEAPEGLGRTLVSWVLASISVISLIVGMGNVLLANTAMGWVLIAVFCVTLFLTVRRLNQDFPLQGSGAASKQ